MANPRTGPAGTFPGTTHRGGLNIRTPYPYNDLVRVIDEWGNVRMPEALATEFYPQKLPPTPSGTPSYTQCQLLTANLATTLAQRVVRRSSILRFINRQTAQGNLATSALAPPSGYSGNTAIESAYTYSESVPVDVLLSVPTLIDNLADRMASAIAANIDGSLLEVTLSAYWLVGTAGTALTTTVLNSAVSDLSTLNEPIFIAIHPLELGWSSVADFGNGLPLDPIPYMQAAESATITDCNTWADVLAASDETANTQPGAWLIPTPLVPQTGSGPVTTHNFAFTPSALLLATVQVPEVNDGTNAQSLSVFENFALSVAIRNTGSGNQTVYAGVFYGVNYISANGVQVKS